jgi:hypothetical protein
LRPTGSTVRRVADALRAVGFLACLRTFVLKIRASGGLKKERNYTTRRGHRSGLNAARAGGLTRPGP